jgi:hypothetical protein
MIFGEKIVLNTKSLFLSSPQLLSEIFRILRRTMSLCKAPVVKGKAIPLQALTGPEGSRRLRLPDFKTIGT